jgi:hypothetical protein
MKLADVYVQWQALVLRLLKYLVLPPVVLVFLGSFGGFNENRLNSQSRKSVLKSRFEFGTPE